MKIQDKIKIDNIEYTCIQILFVNNKEIYKVFNSEKNEKIFLEKIENEYRKIQEPQDIEQIRKLTKPKTDIIINKMKIEEN